MASSSNFDLTYNKLDVVAGGALSNATATTGTGSGVTKIISGGSNVSVSPSSGVGDVTISVTAGGSGTVSEVKGTGTVQGITLTGDVTTSGYLTLGGSLSAVDLTSQVTGTLPVGKGGTGATTLSGVLKGNTTSAISAASGSDLNSTFGTQTAKSFYAGPTSGADANPSFRAIAASDVPTLNQNTTGNAATVTGLSVASGKTLTANNTLTLSATDGSTLSIGGGGTLGSAAYTPTSQYVAASSGSAANLTLTGTLSAGGGVGTSGYFLQTTGTGVTWAAASGTSGVSSITGNNGITPSTLTTGPVTLGLAAITPTSVNGITLSGSGTPTLSVTGTSSISGSSSGTNTGDQTNITGTAGNVTGTVTTAHGGTGLTTAPTDGQLLIGNTTTGGYALANITGAGTVSVANGHGTITITGSGLSNPMSALGDTIYGGSSPAGTPTKLVGNIIKRRKYLSQIGTGSVSQAPEWVNGSTFNVKDYGALGDGVNDDTAAINAAVADVCANTNTKDGSAQGCVYFPAGTYLISGTQGSGSGVQADGGIHLPLGLSSTLMIQITFKGDGPKNSVIMQSDTGDGIHIDFSNQLSPNGDARNAGYLSTCNIFDLGLMACNTSGSSGTASNVAIFIKNNAIIVPECQTGNHIRNVAIWNPVNGYYNYGLNTTTYNNTGWTYGIILRNNAHAFLSNISLHGNSNAGNRSAGWATTGAGSGYAIWINGGNNLTLDGILASYWGKALYINTISGFNGPQGVLITRFNAIANNYGIHVEGAPQQGWGGLTSVFVENFQIDNGNQVGTYYPYAHAILIENAVDVRISNGNVEYNTTHNTNAAIEFKACYTSTISNCWIGQTGSAGSGASVLLTGNSSSEYTSGCLLSNNVFMGWVQIDSNCDNNYVGPNSYNGKVGIYDVPSGTYHPHQRIPQVTDNGSNTINIDQYMYNINPVYN